MMGRWLCYLLALVGALAFRVAYTGWLAGVVFALVLCFPLMGLAAALPGVLTGRLVLTAAEPRKERGQSAGWIVAGESPLGLPLGRIKVTVRTQNVLTGQEKKKKQTWFCPGEGGKVYIPAPSDHCGLLEGKLIHAWAADSLGLFWLPLRRKGTARQWIFPLSQSRDLPPIPQEEAPGLRPRPGGGPGEDYDPRQYRPGDPLSSIHWKLSAKRDELVTRETLETVRTLPLLSFDCFGDPDTLDQTLDLLSGVSTALLGENRPHAVTWADPVTGELRRFSVDGEGQQILCLEAILSRNAPLNGRSVLDEAHLDHTLHLKPVGSPGVGGDPP
ncbi:MAG: DUF58 domain-containing protein [Oscillospiraceae bacterium]|nr:DUF58 domain-containing protein [Oscillospiraceae bacterium]